MRGGDVKGGERWETVASMRRLRRGRSRRLTTPTEPISSILAPSGHNTQPWLFGIRGKTVELRADRPRALPVVDPDDRALVISCGAALGALRIAARRFSFRAAVESLPNPNDEDLLARVSLEQGDRPSEDEKELFGAIPERHSNRQAFEDRELPGDLTERLVADAEEGGVSLHLARGDDRAAIARASPRETGSRWPTSASGESWRPGFIPTGIAAMTGCAATASDSASSCHTPDRS